MNDKIKKTKDILWELDKNYNQSIPETQKNINEATEKIVKLFAIPVVGWRSEQLPEFDVQEINEILQDCKEKKEDLQALICRIWNKGYMTAVKNND